MNYLTPAGMFAFNAPPIPSISFNGPDGNWIMRVWTRPQFRIEVAEGVDMDDATRMFIERCNHMTGVMERHLAEREWGQWRP